MNEDMLHSNATRRTPSSRLTCAQCERMLLDAADETLLPEEQVQFDLHLAGCDECNRAMADAQRGMAWLGMLHAVPPAPSPLLLEQILARTSGDPAIAIPLRSRNESILSYAGTSVLASGTGMDDGIQRTFAFGPVRRDNWFRRVLASVSQPRFAMTTAMAFFSIALTMNLTGVSLRDLHASSFRPSNLRHTFWATNTRVFRYYDNLRVVYELESRVREVQRDADEPAHPAPAPVDPKEKSPGPTAEPHSSLPPARTPHATVDVPSHSTHGTLLPGSFSASAALKRGEGARA